MSAWLSLQEVRQALRHAREDGVQLYDVVESVAEAYGGVFEGGWQFVWGPEADPGRPDSYGSVPKRMSSERR